MALEKKWVIKKPGDPEAVRRLSAELGIDEALASLLVQRGIRSQAEARSFLRPQLDQLHDPFLMKDMDKAVERLSTAINRRERILIYGDYDVDGTTAVSLVYSFLKKHSESDLDYYIPNRYDEGYGISYKCIDWASENGFTLIVALDCGIKAVEKVKYAKAKGVDFIICDHHLPGETLPEAEAVLDPKRADCSYPFDDLSGCGVGFKFMQAFAIKNNIPAEDVLSFLDLLVVSIASDLVSITGENRVLASYGLKQLNSSPRRGLLSIIKLSGLDKHSITIDDIVFKIGPRINAAGRMESGKTAVDLLTSRNDDDARLIGDTINTHNNDRKNEDRRITQEASDMVANFDNFNTKNSTIVYNPSWHKGVLGIVASRLVESYYKPTIVLSKSNGFVTGSARSIPGFDLYEAIEKCSEYLENFGGHMYAAGLTLKEENLKKFCEKFESVVSSTITREVLTPIVEIDATLDFKQITPEFFEVLKQFQPFGPGNPAPVFVSQNVYDNGNGRKVGSDSGHLKLDLIQEDDFRRSISAIAFNLSEHFDHLKDGNPVDICYAITENYYRGVSNIQLRIKDIKPR